MYNKNQREKKMLHRRGTCEGLNLVLMHMLDYRWLKQNCLV